MSGFLFLLLFGGFLAGCFWLGCRGGNKVHSERVIRRQANRIEDGYNQAVINDAAMRRVEQRIEKRGW